MKLNRLPAFVISCLLSLALSCQKGAVEEARNLDQGQRVFDRLQIGMSHTDGCWYLGVVCHPERAEHAYGRDFGRSFSKKEIVVTMQIKNQKVVSVELQRPVYDGKVRKFGASKVLARKDDAGVSGNTKIAASAAAAVSPQALLVSLAVLNETGEDLQKLELTWPSGSSKRGQLLRKARFEDRLQLPTTPEYLSFKYQNAQGKLKNFPKLERPLLPEMAGSRLNLHVRKDGKVQMVMDWR